MRDYLIILLFAYCSVVWAILIHYFVNNHERHKKEYGELWFLTIVITTIISPILIAVAIVSDIIEWLIGKNQNGSSFE